MAQAGRVPGARVCLTVAVAEVELRDNPDESRFEAWVDGERAGVLVYQTTPGRIILVHTEVLPAFGGQGVAPSLVRQVFEEIRERGDVGVVVVCPFVRSWLKRNPQYRDVVRSGA